MVKRAPALMHFLMILVFVMGQVSPACAFVSGKTGFLEICAADGTMKIIEVPAEYALMMPQGAPSDEKRSPHEAVGDSCAFCFAQSHIVKHIADTHAVQGIKVSEHLRIGAGSIIQPSAAALSFQARAPPFSFV